MTPQAKKRCIATAIIFSAAAIGVYAISFGATSTKRTLARKEFKILQSRIASSEIQTNFSLAMEARHLALRIQATQLDYLGPSSAYSLSTIIVNLTALENNLSAISVSIATADRRKKDSESHQRVVDAALSSGGGETASRAIEENVKILDSVSSALDDALSRMRGNREICSKLQLLAKDPAD
jgi:hypothetical protein